MRTEHSCFTHPTRQALSFCHSCRRYFCSDCLVESEEFYYCKDETCQNELHQEKVRISSGPSEQAGKVSFFKRVAKLRTWIWPHITDVDSAKRASKQGYWACAFIVGWTLLFVVLSLFGKGLMGIRVPYIGLFSLLDVSIYIIIGWGIYKMNRIAAVAGLFVYLFARILIWAQFGFGGPWSATIISLMFVNAVRGTFEYHKYSKETKSTTVV
jgi:hypothetical protein